MQNDLISRSRVIENIWDIFNSYANDSQRFDEYETEAINKAFSVLQKTIEGIPTAYDVEQAKMPTQIHPIPLDTQMYIKELERTNVWIKCSSGKMPKEGQYVLVKLSDDIETESEIQIRKYEPSRDKEYPWKEIDFGSWLRFDLVIEWKPL